MHALHIAYCILHIALLLLLLCVVNCVTQNCIPARAMRLYLGWVLRCAYYILHCYVYCTYYIVICGPITAYLLLHVMARLKRSPCCTIYILLRMLSYCVVVHAVLQRKCIVAAFAKRPLRCKLITLRIVWLVLPFPLLPYSSIVARIRL